MAHLIQSESIWNEIASQQELPYFTVNLKEIFNMCTGAFPYTIGVQYLLDKYLLHQQRCYSPCRLRVHLEKLRLRPKAIERLGDYLSNYNPLQMLVR